MVQAVLFDMDGVLLDTERFGMELMPQVLARHGYHMTEELYRSIMGTNSQTTGEMLRQVFGEAYPHQAIEKECGAAYLDMARQHKLPLKEGLAQCMEGLRKRGIRRALATSTGRAMVEVYLQCVPAFQGAFDAVVCGTDVAHSKPAPDIYLQAARELGVAPDACIGVEDSRNGLLSLSAAGIPGVMIPDVLPYDESFAGIVRWKLDSLSQLCPLVDRLNGGEASLPVPEEAR